MPVRARKLPLDLHFRTETRPRKHESAINILVGKVMWQSKFPKLFWIYFCGELAWDSLGLCPQSCSFLWPWNFYSANKIRFYARTSKVVVIYTMWQCCGMGSSNFPDHFFCQICNLQYFDQMVWKLHPIHYYFVRNSHEFWTGRKEVMPGLLEKVGFEHPTLYSIQRKFEYILFFCLYNTNNSGF